MPRLWLSPDAGAVIEKLKPAGIAAWVVGGCVRDMLLGMEPHDWDIAAAADPAEIIAALVGYRVVETGLQHGTVTVVLEGGNIEVTACRADGEYRDMRRPESVRFTRDLTTDLARRDFTINAMAYNADGLVDLHGGESDLARGVIRCVGEPRERFHEDALRILRALRFAATLGFTIDPATADAARENAGNLRKISAERVAIELKRLLLGIKVTDILIEYSDIFCVIIPELRPLMEGHVYTRNAEAVGRAPGDLPVRLAALLFGVSGDAPESAENPRKVLRALKMETATIHRVSQLILHFYAITSADPAAVKRLMYRHGPDFLRSVCDLRAAFGYAVSETAKFRAALEGILASGECWNLGMLQIRGDDAARLGYTGPEIAAALERALFAVFDGVCENYPAALITYLRR